MGPLFPELDGDHTTFFDECYARRLCTKPPYIGGDPNTRHIKVDPGVNKNQSNLWRDSRTMHTRISVIYEQHDEVNYFLFERTQARCKPPVNAQIEGIRVIKEQDHFPHEN